MKTITVYFLLHLLAYDVFRGDAVIVAGKFLVLFLSAVGGPMPLRWGIIVVHTRSL